MSLSDAYERNTLQWLFSPTATPPRPAAIFLGLAATITPVLAFNGAYSEPIDPAYARVPATFVLQPTAPDGVNFVANSALIPFPEASVSWGFIAYCLVFDALTRGNLIGYTQIVDANGDPAPIEVLRGQTVVLAPLSVQIACD